MVEKHQAPSIYFSHFDQFLKTLESTEYHEHQLQKTFDFIWNLVDNVFLPFYVCLLMYFPVNIQFADLKKIQNPVIDSIAVLTYCRFLVKLIRSFTRNSKIIFSCFSFCFFENFIAFCVHPVQTILDPGDRMSYS